MEPEPFQFRLERVRELRRRSEEAALRVLSDALSELRAEADLADAAAARVADARDAQAQAGGLALSGSDLIALQAWRERSEAEQRVAIDELRASERRAAIRRAEAIDAQRRRQVLDRLSERQEREHRVVAERRVTAVLDDIATGRHGRSVAA